MRIWRCACPAPGEPSPRPKHSAAHAERDLEQQAPANISAAAGGDQAMIRAELKGAGDVRALCGDEGDRDRIDRATSLGSVRGSSTAAGTKRLGRPA